MRSAALAFLLSVLVLPACSDYALRTSAPPADEPGTPGDPPGPLPGSPPVAEPGELPPAEPSDPPDGPWDNPDPGSLPDLVFLAPWSTSNTVMDFEQPRPDDSVSTLDWSFVAFDLQGQVLLELELPGQEGRKTNPRSVEPAGPGRFLASIQWEDEETGKTGWEAWTVDAVTEEMELVASWTGEDGAVILPQAGRELDLGDSPMLLHLDVWPTDPELLLIWVEPFEDFPSLHPLRLVHTHDASVPVDYLDPDSLFGANSMMGPTVPWDLDVELGPDGEPVILGGLRMVGSADDFTDWWTLRAWTPSEDAWWDLDIDWPGIKQEAALGLGSVQPLATAFGDQVSWETEATPLLSWSEGGAEVAAVPELGWRRVGPVLETAGPTVTSIGMSSQGGWHDQLDIFHAGEQVWSIEELRFGLVERSGFFGQLILLETETD